MESHNRPAETAVAIGMREARFIIVQICRKLEAASVHAIDSTRITGEAEVIPLARHV